MLSNLDLDARAIEFIPFNAMHGEPELFTSKWWDYRFIHPMQATEMFAEEYQKAIKRGIKQRADLEQGTRARIFKSGRLVEEPKRTITGMWKARRKADELGVKYDTYCRLAVNYSLLCHWQYLPTPTQMYSEVMPENGSHSMVSYIKECWGKTNPLATHERYLAENYSGHPYERDYVRHILDRIKKSKFKPAAVATYVYQHGLVKPDLLIAMFGQDANAWLTEAKLYVEETTTI